MDKEALIAEMSKYEISDLELVCKTQKELYSIEEMQIIEEILEQKKTEHKKSVSEAKFGETLFCIVGLLTPLSALIVGIIMIVAGSPIWKSVGKKTLFVVFIAVLIRIFLYSGGFTI